VPADNNVQNNQQQAQLSELRKRKGALSDEELLNYVRLLYFQSIGSSDFVEEGVEAAQQLPKKNPLRDAYHGTFLCLLARDSSWPMKKWRLAQDGLALLDRAVHKDGEAIEPRFLRSTVTYHLPFFFDRQEQAQQDIGMLLKALRQGKFKTLDKDLQLFALHFFASTDLNQGDASYVQSLIANPEISKGSS
jgi:hypothetical protein